ncbi:YgiQ family radical SAM protein [Saccharicrinis sp. FJH62]|uniref:YgiQ family radical SAM protein n=1 Tax=Saccharicrinis sp. FJH62 TaxID=3344657 RepID=UPI0035D46804
MSTTKNYNLTDWLPTTKKEMELRGWDQADVILFSGDAYIDHPSFGHAVIGRLLESMNLKVALVPQPNWRDDLRDFKKLGKPRLFFGVTAGCMDSMVNHYTANKRLRSNDAYTADGRAGARPDYATTVYSNILKDLFPDIPVLIGGVEASLRRVTHYDYWQDQLMPSILESSKADLLIYGMGETALKELVRLLERGVPFESIKTIEQTAFIADPDHLPKNKNWEDITLASHEICMEDKTAYARNFAIIERESNKWFARRLLQPTGNGVVVINPPFPPMDSKELDKVHALPYTRMPHPKYRDKHIPAYEMIKFSVNMHRGCFGGCSFCTISAHQGKFVVSRSKKSIIDEVKQLTEMADFKGYVSDLGGPSANMYQMQGKDLDMCKRCARPSCIYPIVCDNLDTDHTPMLEVYNEVDSLEGVKKSFVGSGIRYDLLLNPHNHLPLSPDKEIYLKDLITKHVSGRLKVAPEHTEDEVLKMMRKPSYKLFYSLKKYFDKINQETGMNQQLIPYFISSHPGCEAEHMADLAVKTKTQGFKLEQVQDFTPTPMTLATVMYYSGIDPYTGKPVTIAKNKNDKLKQRSFFFWYKKEYRTALRNELTRMNRKDLIGKLLD